MTLQDVTFFQHDPTVDGYQPSGLYFGNPFGADKASDGYTVTAGMTTVPMYLGNARGYTMQFSCPGTGSPNGTLKLQGCCDKSRARDGIPDIALQNWFDIPFTVNGSSSTTQTISGASQIALTDPDCYYRWIRGVLTVSSGSMVVTWKVQWKSWV